VLSLKLVHLLLKFVFFILHRLFKFLSSLLISIFLFLMLKFFISKEIFMFFLLSFKILIIFLFHVFKVKLKFSSLLFLKRLASLKIFLLFCNQRFFISNLCLTFHLLINFELFIHFLKALNVRNQLLKFSSFNKNLFRECDQETLLISFLLCVSYLPDT